VAAKKNFRKKLQRLFSPIKTRVFERKFFRFRGVIHRWEQPGGEQVKGSNYRMAQAMRGGMADGQIFAPAGMNLSPEAAVSDPVNIRSPASHFCNSPQEGF
jgi:hypothetical protein